ncbi:MAG: hypothetical protein Q8Q97_01495 [bacterium]|nr:hypothetical protein [bacterium]
MKNSQKIWLAIILISAVFVYGQALVPALRVNGETLSWRDFFRRLDGFSRYKVLSDQKISDLDLERGVLLSFTEEALIKGELSLRGISDGDVEKFVAGKVNAADIPNLDAASRRLYGWGFEDFKKLVLYPQARLLMLMEEFSAQGGDAASRLDQSLQTAKISVYLPRWKWSGGEFERRY